MKLITVCVPAFNEGENIFPFYESIKNVIKKLDEKYLFEILFINDGSHDDTLVRLQELSAFDNTVKYVDLSRNYGKEVAMAAGFDFAKGDAVITMDADLQHPPEIIVDMILEWENGYQDVYGKRVERLGESWFKKNTSKLYYKFLSRFSKLPVLPGVGDYRLLDRICIEGIKQLRETQRYTKGLYMWVGYRKKEVEFIAQDRFAGSTKWSSLDLIGLAIDGILSNSVLPLRLATFLGIGTSLLSFIYMCYILFTTLIFGNEVPGYPTITVLVLFLGGFQLLAMGIIGEYLGKVYLEIKGRPLYLIQKYSGDDDFEE